MTNELHDRWGVVVAFGKPKDAERYSNHREKE